MRLHYNTEERGRRSTILSSSPLLPEVTALCCLPGADDDFPLEPARISLDMSKNKPRRKPINSPGTKFLGLKLKASHGSSPRCCCRPYQIGEIKLVLEDERMEKTTYLSREWDYGWRWFVRTPGRIPPWTQHFLGRSYACAAVPLHALNPKRFVEADHPPSFICKKGYPLNPSLRPFS